LLPVRTPNAFTLLEILVALALSGLVVVLALWVLSGVIRTDRQGRQVAAIEEFRGNLVAFLRSDTAWLNTVGDPSNGNLACLRAGTSCTGATGSFRVWTPANPATVFYDPTAAATGVSPEGAVCQTFNPASGSGRDECPWRIDLTWLPVCTNAACTLPQVRITGVAAFNPRTGGGSLNWRNYGFDLVRPALCPPGVPAVGFDPAVGLVCGLAPPTGTFTGMLCGAHQTGGSGGMSFVPCEGMDPAVGCPPSHTQAFQTGFSFAPGVGFFTCGHQ
jgi:prepilin-type N-terminal cleavage/methylation domain-containing protein